MSKIADPRRASSSLRGGALVFMALGFCMLSARAQTELLIEQAVSPIKCLRPSPPDRGLPLYPEDELAVKAGATVLVQLTFESADASPRVKVLKNTGVDDFADSVKEYVRRYRLPCLTPGEVPAQARQEFFFDPGDGRKIVYGDFIDEPNQSVSKSCFSLPSEGPRYPQDALARDEWGTLLARVRFDQPHEAPKVSIIYNARSPRLERTVQSYLEEYRFICPLPGGKSVVATQSFNFVDLRAARYAFKDMGFPAFLKAVDPMGLTGAKFDLNQLSCPFDLSVKVRKPYSENVVGEYGNSDPRRKQFIEWVKQLTVMMPRETEPYLFDKTIKVSVPCMVLDLSSPN